MSKTTLLAGIAAAIAMPGVAAVQFQRRMEEINISLFAGSRSRGKGRGKRPYHPSSRFVAMDKREAAKKRGRK